MKDELNWVGILLIIAWSCLFALIGIGIIPVVLKVNNYHVSYFYAQWVSYMTIILISYLFFKDIKLTIKRESYMRFFIKNYSKKK